MSGKDPDSDLIERAVGDLARRTRFPVAFGGMLHEGAVRVSAVAGARTRRIDGLVVRPGRGLGGRAVIETRPRVTLDYRTAKSITHDYDSVILGEGIATLFAVPVIVSGTARGVLYCGSWGQRRVGEVAAQPAFAIADDVASELRIRDEVRRRLSRLPDAAPAGGIASALQEEIRETYAELRRIAASVEDSGLRAQLHNVEHRLAALSREEATVELDVPLSPREIDVLACAALGSTNSEIGSALGVKEATVKSYLASAMAKLDVSTRHSAVAKARRAGILP